MSCPGRSTTVVTLGCHDKIVHPWRHRLLGADAAARETGMSFDDAITHLLLLRRCRADDDCFDKGTEEIRYV